MKLEDLKKEKPTQIWRERMSEDDDDIYTEDNISASEKILDDFVDTLIELGDNPSQDDIMNCVKDVVLKFIDLNEEYDYFIETMEREESWEFIDEAAYIAGLQVKNNVDITEEWRDW